MANALVWLEGKVTAPEDAKVSVFDRGFLFGDGVYETGRTYRGCPLYLEEHLVRLRRSASKLFIEIPWTDEYITKGLFETLTAFNEPEAYFRTIVTRGRIEKVGLEVISSTPPTLVHIVQKLSTAALDQKREKGVTLLTSKIVRNAASAQDPNIKTSNYLNSLLALQDAKARGAEDAILCDANGNVTEGTTFSVFGVTNNDVVITPALGVGILDSITRRKVLDVATPFYQTREGVFSLNEMHNCREVFIASSVREIVPVASWDGKTFGEPRPVTRNLQKLLRDAIDGYVNARVK